MATTETRRHVRPIRQPGCDRCDAPATVELWSELLTTGDDGVTRSGWLCTGKRCAAHAPDPSATPDT